jgi:hypothetical protein
MESPHPKVSCCILANHFGNSILHFAGSFVGECQCQYGSGFDSVLQKMSDPVGQNPRFARSRTSNDQGSSVDIFNGKPLIIIQSV